MLLVESGWVGQRGQRSIYNKETPNFQQGCGLCGSSKPDLFVRVCPCVRTYVFMSSGRFSRVLLSRCGQMFAEKPPQKRNHVNISAIP